MRNVEGKEGEGSEGISNVQLIALAVEKGPVPDENGEPIYQLVKYQLAHGGKADGAMCRGGPEDGMYKSGLDRHVEDVYKVG